MAREVNRLSAVQVKNATRPGYYADGDGLYLQVSESGAQSWVFRYRRRGIGAKAPLREMGLGPARDVKLAEARELAADSRKLLRAGIDPIDNRKAQRLAQFAQASKVMTFKAASETYIKTHKAGWKNPKHIQQWENTLSTYAYPTLGHLGVADIDTALVLKVLEPIWTKKTETASRLRGRIDAILDWAKAKGLRQGDNPAALKGNLGKLLPERARVQKQSHHAALPYDKVGAFMAALRASSDRSARGLELLILTAVRTSELINAQWSEFDTEAKMWTIPAERMKAGKEHRVPLCETTLAVLEDLRRLTKSKYVLPGRDPKKPASNMIFLQLLKRLGREDLTAHGFRSTFRDWAAEQTAYPREVAEMALAHTIGDKTEAAYRRGDLFDKRRRLMADWAAYCGAPQPKGGRVVPIRPEDAA